MAQSENYPPMCYMEGDALFLVEMNAGIVTLAGAAKKAGLTVSQPR